MLIGQLSINQRTIEKEPIRRSVNSKLVILLRDHSRLRRQDQQISFTSYLHTN